MKRLNDVLEGMFDADDSLEAAGAEAVMDEMNAREEKVVRDVVDVFIKYAKWGVYSPMKQPVLIAFNKFLKDIRWRMIHKSNDWWKNPPYETNQVGVYIEQGVKLRKFIIFIYDDKRSCMITLVMELKWEDETMLVTVDSASIKEFEKIWNSSDVKHKYVLKPLKK